MHTDGLIAMQQHTLKNSINCSGVGLHSGVKVTMCLHPAPADTGIIFRRIDMGPGAISASASRKKVSCDIPARWDAVSDTVMSTTIARSAGIKVATIGNTKLYIINYNNITNL